MTENPEKSFCRLRRQTYLRVGHDEKRNQKHASP
jgi:hypothetical protein